MFSRDLHFLPVPFVLGDPMLDRQHDGLLESLDALRKISDDPLAADKCNQIMSELTGKMAQHFDYEESLMKRIGLADDLFEMHAAAHTAIIDDMAQLHMTSICSGYAAPDILVPLVSGWVLSHLMKFDLSLKPLIGDTNKSLASSRNLRFAEAAN